MKRTGPSYEFQRMKTSSDSRNRAIALNVEVSVPMYKIHHSMVIADLALAIADVVEAKEGVTLDRFVVENGALLHDIGISQTIDDLSPEHSMIGADMVRLAGYPESVARCVEFHDAGGLVPEVIAELALPTTCGKADTLPETWEEKAAVFADLIITMEGEYGVDLWNEPTGAARVTYPYMEYVYRHRRGLQFTMDHPQLLYEIEFGRQMMRYCPRELYERFRPGINRMTASMRFGGIPLPPTPMLTRWP